MSPELRRLIIATVTLVAQLLNLALLAGMVWSNATLHDTQEQRLQRLERIVFGGGTTAD